MAEWGTALALVFVLEGLLYALFPTQLRRMMIYMLAQAPEQWRMMGLATATIGMGIIWAMKTFG